MHQLSLACRQIRRRPGFAIVAVLLLALGAGANAAVFSVIRGVLLRPLPYAEPDRLMAIWPGEFVLGDDIDYWRAHVRGLSSISTLSPGWMMSLVGEGGEPLKVTGARVSDDLFVTLGAPAIRGRALEPGDGSAGRDRVVVLSESLWRSRFAADPRAVGRVVLLDQEPYTIVGVMPGTVDVVERATDLWVPLHTRSGLGSWKATGVRAFGRLAPGTTVDAATRELQALAPAMRRDLARADDWGRTLEVIPLQRALTGDVRPALLILMGAVALTWLLAAANLGTLVLGRSIERMREMAVRTALGASRAVLAGQILLEQAVLAAIGSGAGVLLAWAGLPALVARMPPEVPRTSEIAVDWIVFGTVLAGSVGVTVLTALLPGLLTARPSLQPLLRSSRVADTPARQRMLGALVSVQVALAVVLGAGAVLMLRSLWNLQHEYPGFSPDHVLTFRLQTTAKYQGLSTGLPYLRQVVERVEALPGVASVGAIAHLPLSTYAWSTGVHRSDQPPAAGENPPVVGWRFIGWDYFAAMQIPLRQGRVFGEADTAASMPVAILNETMARQFFGDPAAAVGRTLVQHGGGRPQPQTVTVVGVVGDVRHLGLGRTPAPEFYRPLAQTFMFPMAFVVRTSVPPASLAGAVRAAALDVDPVIPVAELQPYTTLVAESLARPRLLSTLLAVFAGSGLLLVAVGLYGVVAYRVRQREPEIGVRLALGADPARIRRSVLAQGLWHTGLGIAVGLPVALALSGLLAGEIYGIAPRDPASLTLLVAVVVAAALLACYVPSRRASRVDPVIALRAD